MCRLSSMPDDGRRLPPFFAAANTEIPSIFTSEHRVCRCRLATDNGRVPCVRAGPPTQVAARRRATSRRRQRHLGAGRRRALNPATCRLQASGGVRAVPARAAASGQVLSDLTRLADIMTKCFKP